MANTTPPFSIEQIILPLFESGNCPFVVYDQIVAIIAAKRYGSDRLSGSDRDELLKWAKKKAERTTDWLIREKHVKGATAWLSGADVKPMKVFPRPDVQPGSLDLPHTLHDDLVTAWRSHPGHADVPVYANPEFLDFVTKREQSTCPRTEPLVAEQTLTSVFVNDLDHFKTWVSASTTIEIPGEACDKIRHVAQVRYERDGREGICCCPMTAYWHPSVSAAREADRQAVMKYLNGLYRECLEAGRSFEVYAPGAIPKMKDKKPGRRKEGGRGA